MGSPNLGTLELVEVRKVWNHEERDFTPWLADNLPRLNAVLDMNLELVATEDRKQDGPISWQRTQAAERTLSSRTNSAGPTTIT